MRIVCNTLVFFHVFYFVNNVLFEKTRTLLYPKHWNFLLILSWAGNKTEIRLNSSGVESLPLIWGLHPVGQSSMCSSVTSSTGLAAPPSHPSTKQAQLWEGHEHTDTPESLLKIKFFWVPMSIILLGPRVVLGTSSHTFTFQVSAESELTSPACDSSSLHCQSLSLECQNLLVGCVWLQLFHFQFCGSLEVAAQALTISGADLCVCTAAGFYVANSLQSFGIN